VSVSKYITRSSAAWLDGLACQLLKNAAQAVDKWIDLFPLFSMQLQTPEELHGAAAIALARLPVHRNKP